MKAAGIIRQVDDLGKISEKKRLTVHIYGSTDNGEEHRTIVLPDSFFVDIDNDLKYEPQLFSHCNAGLFFWLLFSFL